MLGQIYLLHREGDDTRGVEIALPSRFESWEEFCDIHGVDFRVLLASLEELFFNQNRSFKSV